MDYMYRKKLIGDIGRYCDDKGDCKYCEYSNDPDAYCAHYRKQNCPDSVLEAWHKTLFEDPEDNNESVNHPSHYQGKHECINEMRALFGDEAVKAFCRCNIWKYTYRADSKNGEEDRKKAEWYMDYLMKMEKVSGNKSLLG